MLAHKPEDLSSNPTYQRTQVAPPHHPRTGWHLSQSWGGEPVDLQSSLANLSNQISEVQGETLPQIYGRVKAGAMAQGYGRALL